MWGLCELGRFGVRFFERSTGIIVYLGPIAFRCVQVGYALYRREGVIGLTDLLIGRGGGLVTSCLPLLFELAGPYRLIWGTINYIGVGRVYVGLVTRCLGGLLALALARWTIIGIGTRGLFTSYFGRGDHGG